MNYIEKLYQFYERSTFMGENSTSLV